MIKQLYTTDIDQVIQNYEDDILLSEEFKNYQISQSKTGQSQQHFLHTQEDSETSHKADNQLPIIINPDGSGAQIVPATIGLSPQWARFPVSYHSYETDVFHIKKNKMYKEAFKNSQFGLIPVQKAVIQHDETLYQVTALDNELLTLPVIYEFNTNFETPIFTFSVLLFGSNPSHDAMFNLAEIVADNRPHFLVSNWKFIKKYFSQCEYDRFFSK